MTWEKVKAPESGFLDDKKCCCVAVQITAQASTQAVDCACLTDHDRLYHQPLLVLDIEAGCWSASLAHRSDALMSRTQP